MKKAGIILFFTVICFGSTIAQSEQEQRIQASYMLAFGKKASGEEVTYWKGKGNLSVSQLVDRHKQYLMQDAGTHTAAIFRAYADAMGRSATPGEVAYWIKGNDTYTTLVKNHVQYLAGNSGEYEKVIRASYQNVMGRQPSGDEIRYWQGQQKVPYMLLISYHQDYQIRNKPAAAGNINFKNVRSVTTMAVTRTVAAEAAGVAGLPASGVIVPGGAALVGLDGGTLIGNDGSTLVGNDGASLMGVGVF